MMLVVDTCLIYPHYQLLGAVGPALAVTPDIGLHRMLTPRGRLPEIKRISVFAPPGCCLSWTETLTETMKTITSTALPSLTTLTQQAIH
jgi:hypothetical protein